MTYGYVRKLTVNLPPVDLIKMIVSWIMMTDVFDKDKSDKKINFKSDTCLSFQSISEFVCAVGKVVVAKGDKQSWKCKIKGGSEYSSIIVGIIDNETVETKAHIRDHTDIGNEGYGVHLNSTYAKYHNVGEFISDEDFNDHETTLYYAKQFKVIANEYLFSMTLDMTQHHGHNCTLSYEFHMKPKNDVKEIRTDGMYTTVAWNNIDIDKQYRVAFTIYTDIATTVELLSE